MAVILKCKMCGGDLNPAPGESVTECEFCGTKQTVPNQDNEKKLTLFSRANRLRFGCEFDKAAGIYESIISEFPEEAEAYWGLVLCKYGIEYVDDPATGKKIPTCHRSSFDSVLDDPNLEQALENADAMARLVYRDEAKAIEELRKNIIEVSSREEPYDIFICYKETTPDGNRTVDSVLAQDVYDALTEKGYRVFFSRVTLEDKLGQEYEPYIFAALNSAKLMLAFGTDYEYYNAVWVKNEWSRFLKLMAQDKGKYLIPCYKNLNPYDMPKEFAKLQAQDMGKVGAMQDLLRGIEKILGGKKTEAAPQAVAVPAAAAASTAPLLKRTFMFLEDGEFTRADELCEQVLNQNPECAEAYLGKLMAELNVRQREELKDCEKPFTDSKNYQKAMRFGNAALQEELNGYINFINERITAERLADVYDCAARTMGFSNSEKAYLDAARKFESVRGFRDADELAKHCREKAEKCRAKRLADVYDYAARTMGFSNSEKAYLDAARKFESVRGFRDADELAKHCREKAETCRKNELYASAQKQMNARNYSSAIALFRAISGWKDADEMVAICQEKRKEYEAQRAAEYVEAEKRTLRLPDLKKQYNEKYREALRLNKFFIKNKLDTLENEKKEKDEPSLVFFKFLVLLIGIIGAGGGLFALIYNIVHDDPIGFSLVLLIFVGGLVLIPFIKKLIRCVKRNKEIDSLRKQLAIIDNTPTFETFVRNVEREEKAREQAKVSR